MISCWKMEIFKKNIKSRPKSLCALLQIHTIEKVILNIFHWNLLVWQKMQTERFYGKNGDLRHKIA